MTKENCYYCEYSICTSKRSANYDKRCNRNECEQFVSENEYFMSMMNGTNISDEPEKEKEVKSVDRKKLELGKSKKALKKEAKIEAEKNNIGSGFSLLDDPRFQDLFQNNK